MGTVIPSESVTCASWYPFVMAYHANRRKTFHEELHSASPGGTYPGRTTVQVTSSDHGRRYVAMAEKLLDCSEMLLQS